MPPELADAPVLDASGETSRLGDAWAQGPAVLIFLRHFACIACTEHVTILAPRLHELTRLGLHVVYVGNGEPRYIEAFVERNGIDPEVVSVITDPSLAAHRVLELPRSFGTTFGPRGLWNIGRELMSGFWSRELEGDEYQQGGVLVVDRDGRVAYLHRDRATGDHASTSDVIAAAMRVAAAGQAIA